MENITIRILARQLQLSAATVSKALTDSHEISEGTKKRVRALAAELNYIPNPYASSLRGKKSKTIAVILPEVADSFFAQAIDGIEAIAQDKGYHVLICLTHESALKEQAILRDFLGGRADGILLSVTSETNNPAYMQELQAKGTPLVFFDRVCEGVETARVVTDDLESAYKATGHLITSGCSRIALLSISPTLSISEQRIEGYKKALMENHIGFRPSDIISCTNDNAQNQKILKKLMTSTCRPDGVIATVEKLATGIYQTCYELQISIPDQVKVIGFSNLPSAMLLNPSLTTVTQPAFEMGKAAASLLFKALAGKNGNLSKQKEVIPSSLEIRGSTG
ncbi:LacI family DNA-binding transcriptional regulator [Flavitalea flava]